MLPIEYNRAMTHVSVDLGVRTQEKAIELGVDAPFRVAILGDFSGRANRNLTGELRPIEIDPSRFEQVMERMNVSLRLPVGQLKFREIAHFHPDKLLGQIAEQSCAEPCRGSARDPQAWDEAIRKIAARHAFHGSDPRQEQAVNRLDQAASAEMRAILWHPHFQELEAAWRSLIFFFGYVETGIELHVELIDVSRGELYKKLPELHRILADPAPGDARWSAIIGLYTFSPGGSDCELLARLGTLARMSGAPFLSAVDARLFGCESIAESPEPDEWHGHLAEENQKAWQRLRQSEDASWIGLAFPRFLLRLPYGKAASAIEAFEFEEMPGPEGAPPVHESYLWANPAMACATLLGREFNRQGWEMRARSMARIDGIPLHTPPGRDPTPPAEIWMTEPFAAKIADAGVMPLASVRNSDAIMLVRFQSIADPAQPLAGPW